ITNSAFQRLPMAQYLALPEQKMWLRTALFDPLLGSKDTTYRPTLGQLPAGELNTRIRVSRPYFVAKKKSVEPRTLKKAPPGGVRNMPWWGLPECPWFDALLFCDEVRAAHSDAGV